MTALPRSGIILALAALALAGCAGSSITGRLDGSADRANARAGSAMSGLFGSHRQAYRAGATQVSDGVYVAAAPVKRSSGDQLPATVQRADAVKLQSRDPMDLPAIAARLGEITGIPHVAALGPAGDYAVSRGDQAGGGQTSESVSSGKQRGSSSRQPTRITGQAGDGGEALTMRPDFIGSLSSVLDEVASHFNAEWTYSGGRVIIRDYVTRQYQLSTIPEDIVGDRNEVGQTSSNTSTRDDSPAWDEIESGLETVVGKGTSISIGRNTGLITVTARLDDQKRIADYLQKVNANLSRQVAIDVNVLTVQVSEEENYGFDLASLATELGKAGITYSGVMPTAAVGGGNLNVGVLTPDISVSSVVKALSTRGKVKVETRTGATTSNNRVVPIEVVTEQAYAARTSISRNTDGNDTGISVDPGSVKTGFEMKLLPRVLNNREMMIDYALSISELDRIRTFGEQKSGQVELPEVTRTRFRQQAMLNNGETLMLAGFERERATSDRSGVGNPRFPLLGGSSRAVGSKVITVILITPRLLDNSRAVAGMTAGGAR